MERLVSSSSMFQVNKSHLFIPTSEPFDSESRVVSLPTLVIHDCKINHPQLEQNKDIKNSKKNILWDNLSVETGEEYPVSCMHVDNSTSCIYIDSSISSSSNSLSLSENLFQKLTTVYDNIDSQKLLESDWVNPTIYEIKDYSSQCQYSTDNVEISLHVPNISMTDSTTIELINKENINFIEKENDNENSVSTSSSISPSHGKLGVPSKAAAILGATEIFTSPSHAAYRRLVDYTHRPTCEAPLLTTDPSTIPSLVYPSLTARSQRKTRPDVKPTEISPEKKGPGKYKIINLGIDEMKEKFHFLRKPGDPLIPPLIQDNISSKSIRLKEIEKLVRMGKLSLEQIRTWDESFEKLLNDKYGLALFYDYLKSEYSEENIEFWIACEEFKTINNSKKMASRAQKIIKDFITTQAPKEVNIDSKTRQITLDSIQHPNINMFDMSQKRIQTLMEIDSYQRFLRSEMHQSFIQDIRNIKAMEAEETESPSSIKHISSIRSAQSSIDVPDSDSILSLKDIRSTRSVRKSCKNDTSSSIIRISSVRSPKSETVVESNIPPSSSENCLKNSVR